MKKVMIISLVFNVILILLYLTTSVSYKAHKYDKCMEGYSSCIETLKEAAGAIDNCSKALGFK